MAKSQPTQGLTIDQIDGITLEICHAETLADILHEAIRVDPNGRQSSCAMMFKERLDKVREMVLACQLGGRQHV